MKGNKQGPFQESFYHQPPKINMTPRGAANRGRSSKGGKKGGGRGR
ncbi:MAG: hypothetical protein AAB955_00025 [Patescibacteria group bacterium]